MDLLFFPGAAVLFVVIIVAGAWLVKRGSDRKKTAHKPRLSNRDLYIDRIHHRPKTGALYGSAQEEVQLDDITSVRKSHEELMREGREERERIRAQARAEIEAREAEQQARREARLADERVQIEPQLAQLSEMRSLSVFEVSFAALHALTIGDSEAEIEILEHLNPEEFAWFEDIYKKLAVKELKCLMESAIAGSVSDYQRVRQLDSEMSEYGLSDGIIGESLAEEWDRMILRHTEDLSSIDVWDDLIRYHEYTYGSALELYDQAKAGDYFSACLVLLIMEYDDPEDIFERLMEDAKEDIRMVIEEQRRLFAATASE